MMQHMVNLNLNTVTRSQLDDFLYYVPERASLSTLIEWEGSCTPPSIEELTIVLQAEWTQP